MFHGATISQIELEQLRRINNIIRLGRVKQITKDKVILDKGEIPIQPNSVFIDCSANALSHAEMKPIFSGNSITIQSVRAAQLVFSAAFIAHVEASFKDDDVLKNDVCLEIPMPDKDTDWIKVYAKSYMNQYKWSKNEELTQWLHNNRLDGFSSLIAQVKPDDTETQMILGRISKAVKPAMEKLQKFASEL